MEKLIQELISLPGACGQEHAVIKYLYERLKDQTDTCYVNGLGDLIVTKKGAQRPYRRSRLYRQKDRNQRTDPL